MAKTGPVTDAEPNVALPGWLLDAIQKGQPIMDIRPNKRREPRVICTESLLVMPDGRRGTKFVVKGSNISCHGIAFIAQSEFSVDESLTIRHARDSKAEPVRAQVKHCTRTLQGFKVGCEFVS